MGNAENILIGRCLCRKCRHCTKCQKEYEDETCSLRVFSKVQPPFTSLSSFALASAASLSASLAACLSMLRNAVTRQVTPIPATAPHRNPIKKFSISFSAFLPRFTGCRQQAQALSRPRPLLGGLLRFCFLQRSALPLQRLSPPLQSDRRRAGR